jgi:hypothetical protein
MADLYDLVVIGAAPAEEQAQAAGLPYVGGTVEVFLALAVNTPTYSGAYHDAAIDGLTRLAGPVGPGMSPVTPAP